MTLRTSLVIAGDGSGAVQALQETERAMGGAEKEAQAMAEAYAEADAAIGALAKVQAQANEELREARAALAAGTIAEEAYERQVLQTKTALSLVQAEHRKAATDLRKSITAYDQAASGMVKVGGGAKLAGYQIQNLAYQVNDMVVGLAGGQKPMTVFLQQGSQIAPIMAQAGLGVGGLAKQLAGAVTGFLAANPLLLAAAAAAGVFAIGVGLVTDEINKNSDVTVTWQDTLLGAFDVVKDAISGRVTAAFEAMGLDVGAVWEDVKRYTKKAIDFIVGAVRFVPATIAATYDKIGPAIGDAFYSGVNLAIGAVNALVKKNADALNVIVDGFNDVFGTKIPKIAIGSIAEIANPYAGAMGRLAKAASQAAVSSFSGGYVDGLASAISDAAQRRARLREAAEKGGNDLGGKIGKAAGKVAADELANALARALEDLPGLLGDINKDTWKLVGGVQDKAWADAMQAANDNIDQRQQKQRDLTDAQAAFNDELSRTIGLLDQVGAHGLGSVLAAIQGLQTGDFSAVGGKAGVLLQTVAGIQWKDDAGQIRKLGEEFHNALKDIFGESFGPTLLSVFQGAATGGAIGGVIFGGSKGGQLGASVGGALGQALGEKVLGGVLTSISSSLGAAAGPIGAIAGSLLGGIVGSLFSKVKKGKATFGADLSVSTAGSNSDSRAAAASGLAGGAIDTLQKIADALGADLGAFTGTIGIRNKSLRYDPTGGGNTKTSKGALDFGQDQEALIKAVIKDAISDGVFEGLSGGIERLLKGEGDLEKQLQKALDLSGVVNAARSDADPLGASLAELEKWKSKMVAIATEAGEGMAEIEAVYGKRRADIVKQAAEDAYEAMRPKRELEIQIMQLEGKSIEALKAARDLEKAGVEESLRPLYDRIYALQDEADKTAEANAAHDKYLAERTALDTRLWELMGREDLIRQQALEALDPLNRSTQEWVWQLERAQKAADERAQLQDQYDQLMGNAAAISERARTALDESNRALYDRIAALKAEQEETARLTAIAQERAGLLQQLYTVTGNTAALQAMQLEKLDPSNRALQEHIWSIEKQKAAAEEATRAQEQQANSLRTVADQWRNFAQNLREFRDGLVANDNAAAQSYGSLRGVFLSNAAQAANGNQQGFEAFSRTAQAFLESSKGEARTALDYRRDVALVASSADVAIAAAERQANSAEQQIALMQSQLSIANDIVDVTATVASALEDLQKAQENDLFPDLEGVLTYHFEDMSRLTGQLLEEVRGARAEAKMSYGTMISALNSIDARGRNQDGGDYQRIGNDPDTPVTTVAA